MAKKRVQAQISGLARRLSVAPLSPDRQLLAAPRVGAYRLNLHLMTNTFSPNPPNPAPIDTRLPKAFGQWCSARRFGPGTAFAATLHTQPIPSALERALELCGGVSGLARRLNERPQTVSAWLTRGRKRGRMTVPAEHCPSIELATKGRVRCEELAPKVRWDVLRMGWSAAESQPAPSESQGVDAATAAR